MMQQAKAQWLYPKGRCNLCTRAIAQPDKTAVLFTENLTDIKPHAKMLLPSFRNGFVKGLCSIDQIFFGKTVPVI